MDFAQRLEDLRARGLLRELREVEGASGRLITFAPRPLINFSSNDYLGLSQHEALREAAVKAIEKFGAGSGGSRLLGGSLSPHHELEEVVARLEGTEAALSFSSGYAAAVGTLPALAGPQDVVILDKLSHASLVDAARLSRAILRVFPHNHLGKLESQLEWARANHPEATVVVVTESVFSMDGDTPPLAQIVELKRRYGALLLLDEAHATGVIGERGRGLAHLAGVARDVDIRMGTLSKAVGASGGFIAGSSDLVEYLLNRARSFIYSTAPAPAAAAAAAAGVRVLMGEEGDTLRRVLWERIRQFAETAPERFRPPSPGPASAIFALPFGEEAAAVSAAKALQTRGLYMPAVRYPTVPLKTARLRAAITALHEREQIELAADALRTLDEKLRDSGK